MVDVLEGYVTFPEREFASNVKAFYPLVVELLSKEVSSELRGALLGVLRRVGEVALGIEGTKYSGTGAAGVATGGEDGVVRRNSLLNVVSPIGGHHERDDDAGSDDAASRMVRSPV